MEHSGDIYTHPLPAEYPLEQVALFFEKVMQEPKLTVGEAEILAEPVNPTKNSTIVMDVQRTRSSFFPKELKSEMEKMLVHFCRLQKVEYKQGMNEILAPFIYFRSAGVSVSRCYNLFRTFFDQYCLNFYYDKDFNSLEIIFKMVTVMIKYHDPALARYLENYEIEPQIYCIGWLMTLFASKLSLRLTYTLWQFMAAEKDDYFIFFLIIAIIINRRQAIIQTRTSSIFGIITDLIFKNEAELTNTIKIALLLRKNTPASLILFFKEFRIFKERNSFQRINFILKEIDQISLFLVGPLEVSLKQHFKLGFCEKQCYFCTLRQPIRLNYSYLSLAQYFPALHKLVVLSNDVRTMDYNIEFIVVDVRKDKSRSLRPVEGMRIFEIDYDSLIQTIQANFNEQFLQARGREHFLFVLNQFSFEKEESFKSDQFYFCQKLIKILNSYSYCYLSILQGGESAYGYFLKQLRLKSEILDSKLHPVSQYVEEGDHSSGLVEDRSIVGHQKILQISEIVTLQKLYDCQRLSVFEGEQNSADYLLLIVQGFVIWAQRNGLLQKVLKFIKQHKSIITHLIEQQYVLQIPLKITILHSVFRVHKLTARVHHNNCLLFYLKESEEEERKKYRRGDRRELWRFDLEGVIRQDLEFGKADVLKRVAFDSSSYDVVKQISSAVKASFKEVVKAKRDIENENKRFDELNNNIIQECDFSRKDRRVFEETDFDT